MGRMSGFKYVILIVLFAMGSIFIYYATEAHQTATKWGEGVSLVPEITRVISKYQSAHIERYDPTRKYLVIRISGNNITDGSCRHMARLFHKLCSIGVTLEVHGNFVPSKKNPMTLAWTKVLVNDGQY